MPRAFSTIAYTPSVRQAQERYGSRGSNAGFDTDPHARASVTAQDQAFIENVDTFFMASVGETGWPYVQHRGGPRGFLKVLDERTIGFADFAGNRQYISAGNLEHDARVMLILMDFRTQQRLKIWGRARIVHEREEPELLARLKVPAYRARVERAYVITVEALDINCPQHITQRFSIAELTDIAADADGRAALREMLAPATASIQAKEST
jgi:predicted pyridoxine 5'-phosphate oxidase superfamily flavin-nucleotide-binding protein